MIEFVRSASLYRPFEVLEEHEAEARKSGNFGAISGQDVDLGKPFGHACVNVDQHGVSEEREGS
jgi:hypothetical protein